MRDPNTIYATLSGLPVRFELQWPFHLSTSGADWFSLHGRVALGDGGSLHADVAVNLTQTIKEALPSLEPEHAEAVVINAIRKDLDNKQLELLKSGKRQPVPVSSRHFNFKTSRLIFARVDDAKIRELLERKTYWTAVRHGAETQTWITDPIDAMYVNSTPDGLLQLANGLAADGLIRIEGEHAIATGSLLARKHEMESELARALGELEAKHAFERG